MYRIRECAACGFAECRSYPALRSGFISSYVLNEPIRPTELVECPKCSFRFFAERYDDSEVMRLYTGYREEGYFLARTRWEPWYTRKINESMSTQEIQERHRTLQELVHPLFFGQGASSALDYAGDRGQFLPPEIAHAKYVYDLSGKTPVDGVTALRNPQELRGRTYDLIVVAHSLEHFSDPTQALQEIRSLGTPETVYVFEVPFEHYGLAAIPRKGLLRRLYEAYLQWLSSKTLLFKLVDFVSTGSRIKLGFVPPLGLIKLHEHLNFFSPESLRAMLEKNGFKLVTPIQKTDAHVLGQGLICAAFCQKP